MDNKKLLVLMRGLPGSGKSTKAKQIGKQNPGSVVYSTDDFFEIDGEYRFDGSKIGEYHMKNQQRTELALKNGVACVVVDNTNIKLWEMKKYVKMGLDYGYEIKIEMSETDWAWDPVKCAQKTLHGVPEDKLIMMAKSFERCESINDILQAEEPRPRPPRRGH